MPYNEDKLGQNRELPPGHHVHYVYTYENITDEQVQAALAEYVATHGHSVYHEDQGQYIHDYTRAHNIEGARVSGREITKPYAELETVTIRENTI